MVVKTLSATNVTATSITTSGLTVNGNATTTGILNVGNSQANGKISVNGKVAIRDYGYNWLGINDGYAESWSASGIFFGKSIIRTDNAFQLGNNGDKVLFNTSSAKFTVPVTINNSLAVNNVTATNVTVNGKLVAYQQEIRTIQDLGGEFCVSPTIYIQKASTTIVNVKKKDSTTISISIKDEKAITSSTIQGVKWAKGSKIKIQSKIDGIVIKGDGTMTNTLNTDQYTMAIDVVVDSSIADHFSTAKNNASFDEINIMLYQRYGKKIGSTTENAYSPVGIRMSATGSANAAPYVDIWGSKSSSDPDTVYTIPSVRLGYLDGLKCGTYDCFGYGLYADNVYLNGTIISNSGQLGGFKIGTNDLSNGTWGTDKSVLMSTGTTENKAVGGSSAISGWCFTAGSKFGVTTSGDLYASNANISGKVTATSGTIGGFNITDSSLYTGLKSNYNVDNAGIYMDKNGQIAFGDVSNYIRYYKNASNQYKIDIQTDNILINDNDGVIIGNRKGLCAFIAEDHFLIDDIIFLGYDDLISNPGEHTTWSIARLPYFTLGKRVGEGSSMDDIGAYSFAVGYGNKASGYTSCAIGCLSVAIGDFAFAAGRSAFANNDYSVAMGYNTMTNLDCQTVIGQLNKKDSTSIFVIGNGTNDSNRSNAFTVDWDGNTWAAGSITATGSVKGTDFNGFTINKSVPSDAKFTDTVTVIENSCDSDSTTSALSAAQGKSLKAYTDSVNTNIWNSLTNSYRANYNAQYNTPVPLLINGNSLGLATAQLILEYNNSYIRFRNDGSSFYIMNGNASSWTNFITFQSTGAVAVPSTLQVPTCLYIPYATKASTTSAANAYISADGNGVLAKTSKTSSRRFKDSITTDLDEELNPEHLYDIDVVQFKYKKDYFTNTDDIRYRKNMIGLIAENVYDNYKIAADWHVDEESGKILVDAWNEQYIVPAMLKLIQEQHKEIEKLKQIIGGEIINEG